jgi:ribosomal protein L11 methyltransferase
MTPPRSAPTHTTVLTLEADGRQADALEAWLRSAFGLEPVRIEKPGETRVWIELYFEDDLRARLAARAAAARRGVRGAEVRTLQPRDWRTFWRHHFPVTRIGRRLRLVPAWECRTVRPLRGVRDCVVDPGLSFGTGTHFTTRYCLEAIDALCDGRRKPASLLDVGTGSGILAIAAARLGIPRITATEHDPQALTQARRNARRNGVSDLIRCVRNDLTCDRLPPPHEVLVANLYSRLLADHAATLAAAARRVIVLSGLRELEADGVAAAFEARGWIETERDGDGEWCGMRLAPRAH